MDENLRRAIIMDHYQCPRHREVPKDLASYVKVNSNNESCIDNIDLYLKIENSKIVDVYFFGEACAISTSAASVTTKLLEGKTLDEVKSLYAAYQKMIETGVTDETLEEALAYSEIYKQQNRKHCAMLPWIGIMEAIHQYELSE